MVERRKTSKLFGEGKSERTTISRMLYKLLMWIKINLKGTTKDTILRIPKLTNKTIPMWPLVII